MLHILLVEDSPTDAGLIEAALSELDEQLEITHIEQMGEAEEYLNRACPVDVVLLDLGLPDSMGLGTVERANCAAPHVPIIVLTGLDDEAKAIDAVRKGAQDYQVKGEIRPRTLMRAIRQAIERKQAEQERERLLKAVEVERCRVTDIFMQSPAFMVVLRGPEHVVERANEEYFRLIGRHDILGKPLHAVLPEIEGQGYFEILDGVYQTGEPFVGQGMRVRLHRDGAGPLEERCVDFRYQPMREEDGSISGIFVHGVDVTERKRAEERTRQAKEDWEQTFDTVPDFVAILDDQHRIVRANRPMAERLGVTPEQCIGLHCYEAVHGTAHPPEFCPHAQTCRDGREHTAEVHEPRLGGHFLVTTTPRFDEQSRFVGAVHVARDITARKRGEEEREIAVGFLRLVNESRGKEDLVRAAVTFFQEKSGCEAVGIRLKDGDDYPYYEARGFPQEFVLLENRLCAQDDAGQTVRDSAGNPVIECMCGNVICGRFDPSKPFFTAHGSFWTNCTTELLASTTEADRQARTRNRCNGAGYESVALLPLYVGNERLGLLQLNYRRKDRFTAEGMALWERLAGYLAVALAKTLAEESLRKSEGVQRRAQEIAHLGSWELDIVNGRLTWSDEVYRIFGLQRQEFRASYEAFLEAVHPGDRTAVDAAYSGSLREGRDSYEIEHRVVRRSDGEVHIVHEKCEHIRDSSGRIIRSVGMVHDVTERKRAEEALLEAKAAAEAANIAKSQFLANMSHELRTPMNAILGMIDVALPKATDPTVQDCLQTVKGSADLLLTLLNDLLDSAKIESGKLELETAPFSLRRMLDQLTRVLAVRASENGLCFYCRMPEEMPDAVVGDRMRLQQVLLNLAGNAIKFTEQGEVEVSVHALAQDGEGCLEFAVRDTGIGISPSEQERLFQSFAQADASMARRFGGTGLGLSICKSLVEMMGGRIWVDSEVGQGSTFRFTVRLPLAEELSSDFEDPVAIPTAACAQLRVLLAEDNPANQKLATYVLQDRGHLVEIAGDGQEAIRLTEQNRYDVILMDVQMPGMNGLEATAAIRKREGDGGRVPIIAMTAHAMKGDREKCLAAGMDGYLSKPIDAHEMIALVETLAAGSPSVTAGAVSSPPAPGTPATPVFDPGLALKRREAE